MLRNHNLHPAFWALAIWILAACTPQPSPVKTTPLTVMAAASLSEPFQELGQVFESEYPGVEITFNFAGSQQLAQQLTNDAPADVFASASQKYMDEAIANGRVAQGASQVFANNRLVLITPLDNPGKIFALADLANPGLKLVLAAPEVPVGKYTLDFLEKASLDPAFPASFKDQVLQNVVSYEENVKSILTKILLGEADAGIVYASDVSGESAGKVSQILIPDNLNVIALFPIAVIQNSHQPETAKAFIDLILTPKGQAVLRKYGLLQLNN